LLGYLLPVSAEPAPAAPDGAAPAAAEPAPVLPVPVLSDEPDVAGGLEVDGEGDEGVDGIAADGLDPMVPEEPDVPELPAPMEELVPLAPLVPAGGVSVPGLLHPAIAMVMALAARTILVALSIDFIVVPFIRIVYPSIQTPPCAISFT
jgi:hypothetical protein